MPFPLEIVHDGDWPTIRRNTDSTAARLNPVFPQVRVYNSANISIANTTVTALTFDSERFDEGSLHSTSSNTGRLTAPITGLYLIGACVQWAANATGNRYAGLQVNGTTAIAENAFQAPPAGENPRNLVQAVYRLAAGDYVQALVYQSSGGALNVLTSGNASPEFWMVRLGGYTNMGV